MILARNGELSKVRASQRIPALIVLLMILSLAACTDLGTDLGFRDIGGVQVTPMASELVVQNETSMRVHRIIIGQDLVPVIDWIPTCTDANAIEAGKEEHLAYQNIPGYAAGKNVVVYWWHPVPREGGGLTSDSIRTIVVGTP
jgi:hypothetical protein